MTRSIEQAVRDKGIKEVCQLDEGHEGEHKEVFQRGGEPVTITWGVDESEEEEDWGDDEDQDIL